jgi:hypothetical protein
MGRQHFSSWNTATMGCIYFVGGDSVSKGTKTPQRKVYMKNTIKFFGIIALVAVIGFSLVTCNSGGGGGGGGGSSSSGSGGNSGSVPSTSGSLTITGIPSQYNGKYVGGTSLEEVSGGYMLLAYDGFSGTNDKGVVNLGKISGGRAVLKVWRGNDKGVFSYSGSDSAVSFMLYILNSPSMDSDNTPGPMDFLDVALQTVRFSSGRGSIVWEGLFGGL